MSGETIRLMNLMNVKYWISVYLGCLLSVSVMQAQKVWTDQELNRIKSPQLLEGADKLLVFDTVRWEVGTLSEDDKPSVYTFRGRNVSNSNIVITRFGSSCGCTVAEVSKPVLRPGEETVVSLTYTPFGHPGKLDSQVLVFTDRSEEFPVAVLKLTGKVTPSAAVWKSYRFTWGNLKLRRKSVNFGKILPGQKRVERIACGNAGTLPMKLSVSAAYLPSYLTVYTVPEVLEPAEEGQLVIEIDAAKLSESVSETRILELPLEGVGDSAEAVMKVSFQY